MVETDNNGLPQLNFPAFSFRVSRAGGSVRIWDALRGQWLVLTPEEWVRQHLIMFLVEHCAAPPGMIRQECPVSIQGTSQRADVVVWGRDGKAMMLAECKAPDVDIDAAVFRQAIRYNSILKARYILVTNGLKHFLRERSASGQYTPLSHIPNMGE